jgi:hypothetical protein
MRSALGGRSLPIALEPGTRIDALFDIEHGIRPEFANTLVGAPY